MSAPCAAADQRAAQLLHEAKPGIEARLGGPPRKRTTAALMLSIAAARSTWRPSCSRAEWRRPYRSDSSGEGEEHGGAAIQGWSRSGSTLRQEASRALELPSNASASFCRNPLSRPQSASEIGPGAAGGAAAKGGGELPWRPTVRKQQRAKAALTGGISHRIGARRRRSLGLKRRAMDAPGFMK